MLEMGFCWGEAEPGQPGPPGNLRPLPSIYTYIYIYIHRMVHVYNSRVYSYSLIHLESNPIDVQKICTPSGG